MRLVILDLDALEKDAEWDEYEDGYMAYSESAIKSALVDAERHGHWIITNKPNIYGGTIIKCSECGYEGVIAHIEDHHYCWVCGAKMDEVEE